ncbi:MAG TPA: ATP-dependent RNA helicase HrpA [Spongiibacteraceae bacterium]|nr:ATP-dependent RNA helicase HrpA [Spongiibacteraceae bacterium]
MNARLPTEFRDWQQQVLCRDRHRLAQALKRAGGDSAARDAVLQAIAASRDQVTQRAQSIPAIRYPEQLPVAQRITDIGAAVAAHPVVIVAGETGSGKTTQLPKLCLALGRGSRGLIGHTQPRRIAASSVANRLAEELGTSPGSLVGYQVRFQDRTSEQSLIKVMTDGILLAEIQRDRYLTRYDTLIIDEAHERSLNIDFLLGYLKRLLPRRPDLKLIITSATIDVERFSAFFDGAPVVEVSGRSYPVEVCYRPLEELVEERDLAQGVAQVLEEIAAERPRGDVLVFLPGERDIRETAQLLRRRELAHCQVLPLYGRLSHAEQQRVFQAPGSGWRVVLATNVAETSLTVPGIRYVIDTGLARISRYSVRSKLQRLPIEPVSRASADQRKGRCGRVAEGTCFRLYSEADFLARPEFTDPEILRTNLAAVILQMTALGLGDVAAFPFIEPPEQRQINDGYLLLQELGAIEGGQLSATGRQLAQLPVDPQLGRMLVEASAGGCLREALVVVSALSVQDPRERPADKKQAADEQHRRFQDPDSDFVAWLKLWDYYETQRQELSSSQLKKLCQREFLAWMRMREWRDIHHQLRLACKALGWRENQQPADYAALHRALLAGLLSHIGMQDERSEYLGTRNRRFRLFPGSGLAKKPPRWVLAAEIVETSQVFARCVAKIEPEWVLGINDALLKRSHSEPGWQQRSGRVTALESVTLYGLLISDKQRVNFGPIDPVQAREIFIREALVAGRYRSKAGFFLHNQALIRDIEALEEKTRRRDLLADEQVLFDFYAERIPAEICTTRQFERWLKTVEREQPRLLYMPREHLLQRSDGLPEQAQFPDQWSWQDLVFRLSYRFEPGNDADGVSLEVPLALLNRVPDHRGEWLVPGLLRDKCIALLKALPKQYRKQLVPVPEAADRALAQMAVGDTPLIDSLGQALARTARLTIPAEAWDDTTLDAFYRMNYRVLDDRGQLLRQSRDLALLKSELRGAMRETLQDKSDARFQRADLTRWDFGALPASTRFEQAGVVATAYPALVDRGDSVAIELLDSAATADAASEQGLIRLLQLQCAEPVKYLRRELLRGNSLNLQLAGVQQKRENWLEDLLYASFRQVFVEGRELPRDQPAFEALLAAGRGEIVATAQAWAGLLQQIATEYSRCRKAMSAGNQLAWLHALEDIRAQLDMLFAPGFVRTVGWTQLSHYPRYLQAIVQRLEKLRGQHSRDRQLTTELRNFQQRLEQALARAPSALRDDPALAQYRWMLEEYRVSLFAQGLGTAGPVSAKRLQQQWQAVQAESSPRKAGNRS